jgi:hypothetical protein
LLQPWLPLADILLLPPILSQALIISISRSSPTLQTYLRALIYKLKYKWTVGRARHNGMITLKCSLKKERGCQAVSWIHLTLVLKLVIDWWEDSRRQTFVFQKFSRFDYLNDF